MLVNKYDKFYKKQKGTKNKIYQLELAYVEIHLNDG